MEGEIGKDSWEILDVVTRKNPLFSEEMVSSLERVGSLVKKGALI